MNFNVSWFAERQHGFLIVLQSLLLVDLFLGRHSLVLIAAINERAGSSVKERTGAVLRLLGHIGAWRCALVLGWASEVSTQSALPFKSWRAQITTF